MMRWLLLAATLLGACADPMDVTPSANPDERACAFVGVTGLTINASSTLEYDSLATIEVSDEPWTISLVEGASSWLRFDTEDAEFLRLYVDQPDVAVDLSYENEPMGLPYPAPVQTCAEQIPEHFRLGLDQPGSYHLELAPTDDTELWLMLVAVGDL